MTLTNALAPSAAVAGTNIMSAMQKAHEMAQGMFQHTGQTMRQLATIQTELAGLSKLGDTVTTEDVVKTAGNLVAHEAIPPLEMAGDLATMPKGGEALAGWVADHLASAQANLAQVAQSHAIARHELGTSALRTLALDHGMGGVAAVQTPAAPPALNPLSPVQPIAGTPGVPSNG